MSEQSPDWFGFYARIYDHSVGDWPGEIDFYRRVIDAAPSRDILELACGTGRVCLRLAGEATQVVGLDKSAEMLQIARDQSCGRPKHEARRGRHDSVGLM